MYRSTNKQGTYSGQAVGAAYKHTLQRRILTVTTSNRGCGFKMTIRGERQIQNTFQGQLFRNYIVNQYKHKIHTHFNGSNWVIINTVCI